MVKTLAEDYKGRVVVFRVNAGAWEDFKKEHNIDSFPFFAMYSQGSQVAKQPETGYCATRDDLDMMMAPYVATT